MIIHDLSVALREGMDVFPGDPPFRASAAAVFERDGCNVTDLSMGTHTGTHIDVPRHFLRDGAPLEELPLDRFVGTAVFADVATAAGETGIIDLKRLDLSMVQPGDFLVLYVGWEEKRGTPGFFTGLPAFAVGTAAHLERLGVRLLGMDMPTLLSDGDFPPVVPSTGIPAGMTAMHTELLSRGILILEGLIGLVPLIGRRLRLFCLPLKIVGSDGSPVRAIAIED